ncbi:autophagy-related protein [Canna indica]|uniref:Autophagy-related protein n=1 Tax=Canna indica TaxID=4628 RepID=A0AAQ3KQJ4_9LILI|nr:autophagy-related protein [Canna indica]
MRRGKSKNGLLPSSLRIISSCLKTVSSNAGSVASTVRSAGASVAASIATPSEDEKDQVLWAGFDKLEFGPASFKHVLLLGYSNGFQVLDVEEASDVRELVSKRDGPATFLQMQPFPIKSGSTEGFRALHPLLLVVAGDETNGSGVVQGGRLSELIRENNNDPQVGNCISTPTVVRFYSLKSHNYVHVLRFRSAVYTVRCSPRIVAVALAAQIYCFDAVTLESKFSVLTYPLQGAAGVNIGCGPMAVGPRWLAYASNNPLVSNTGRLSPQNLTPPGVSPSTSPSSNLVARYAMESSKTLAAGILNLGDMGYKTLSKYCQELLPDGSTCSLSPNSSRRSGGLSPTTHPSEPDYAGTVVIKDFTSKEVISQFRAHTSPISALCFDPSGTLLVTASVHGHNINIFRIMPTFLQNGSTSAGYDWSSSHVHLYKLYRGLTAAIIQDISFSHYSQWISIVSSKGTCHIYVLSPFGGDATLQPLNVPVEAPILAPNLTSPWWSSSCCSVHQKLLAPPPPITYSVVSRIKNVNSSWLSTVSNVAASAAGKVPSPSGAIAAVFHNSLYHDTAKVPSKGNSLENLLIYSPSGYVIQHQLRPSSFVESCDSSLKAAPAPPMQLQDDEQCVNAEPVQWWDVCRRLNWSERDEDVSRVIFNNLQNSETLMGSGNCGHNETSYTISTNSTVPRTESISERSHWYLSNAEVQISSGKIPICQRSKICFCVLDQSRTSEGFDIDIAGGEIEIEKFSFDEVEVRQKDLLPVSEQLHCSQSSWGDRARGGNQISSSGVFEAKDGFTYDTGSRTTQALHHFGETEPCKHVSLSSVDKYIPSDFFHISSSMMDYNVASLSEFNASASVPPKCSAKECTQLIPQHGDSYAVTDDSGANGVLTASYAVSDDSGANGVLTRTSSLPCNGRLVLNNHSLNITKSGKDPMACVANIQIQQDEIHDSHNSAEFVQYFDEGYCKVSKLYYCHESTEAAGNVDSPSSHCDGEKPDEYAENDDMLGGVFALSEG